MANEYEDRAIERKRVRLSGIWKVAGKYGNWQENIANGSKGNRPSKKTITSGRRGRSCGGISEVTKKNLCLVRDGEVAGKI